MNSMTMILPHSTSKTLYKITALIASPGPAKCILLDIEGNGVVSTNNDFSTVYTLLAL
jgi:hypothetical protein